MTEFILTDVPPCAFCGSKDAAAYVSGPGGFLCADCALRDPQETPVAAGTRCGLCGKRIGSRRGLLWRQRVTVAVVSNGAVCCVACLRTARQIMHGDSKPHAAA